ncbi:ester cyclase [Luteibacter aegosomatis]|uniref:ester cyclase n=1 Tax=Luteibacter aegosomatis TaxID=2911537 RepID=UPI001FF7F36F|nr:ester cyclase [Luteibacter aegosomatis]UPG85232.1 ester cyclase [Luteibacter aegosomatis]
MSHDSPKAVVRRFNTEVIQNLDRAAFDELMSPGFVNHSAPPGTPAGPESMWNTFEKVLHPALSELRVEVLDQVGEGDKVTSRKRISGVHTGPLLGVPATHAPVAIDVIDIVRVEDGRYVEHWGVNTLPAVLAALRAR